MAKTYRKDEIAAAYRAASKGFGNEKLSDDEVLAKLEKMPGGDKWLARLEPEQPTRIQQMKDLAARAVDVLKGAGTGLNVPTCQQGVARAAPPVSAGLAVPAKTFKQSISEAAEAAKRAVTGQVSRAAEYPPYAAAGVIKGATMGYVDPSKALPPSRVPQATQKRLGAAGEFLAAAVPISLTSRAASLGLKAAGVTAATARPALSALARGAATGLGYGGARKPTGEETRVKNALADAAVFMAFTGTGMAMDKAIRWYKANYTPAGAYAAYMAARQQIIDVFVAKGAQPEKAAEMAEAGLYAAMEAGGGMGKIKPSAFREIGRKVKAGEKVVIGPTPAPPPPPTQKPGPAAPAAAAPRAITPTAAEIPAREIPAPIISPETAAGSTLPPAQQHDFMLIQNKVLENVIARGAITKAEIPSLVLDKAKDGVTLREIVERKISENPETAIQAAADEYSAFLKGIKMATEPPESAEVKAQAEMDKKFPELKNPDYWIEIPGGERFPARTLEEASDNAVAAFIDAMAVDIKTAPKTLTLLGPWTNKIATIDRRGVISDGETVLWDPNKPAAGEIEAPPKDIPAAAPAAAEVKVQPIIPAPEIKTVYNMPVAELQKKIKDGELTAPDWMTMEERAAEMVKYPNGEAYRKWAAEIDIRKKLSKHSVPEAIIEKYGLQQEIANALDFEIAEKQDTIQRFIDDRGGKQPFYDFVRRLGGINKAKLRYSLGIEKGEDWKGREFPDELAGLVRLKGGVGLGELAQEAFFQGMIPENDPALVVEELMKDYRFKQGDMSDAISPKSYRTTSMSRSKPRLDLPGQITIPGTGPAMPLGKIRKEIFVDPDEFQAGFEAQQQAPGLFEALDNATEAGKGLPVEPKAPPKAAGADAATEAPKLDSNLATFQPITMDKEFKLWRGTEMMMERYARLYGEDNYRPRGTVGVFYRDSKNIFLQAANNVYVAVHEIMHFIDDKTNWFKQLMRVTGTTKNGNPIYDPATKRMRALLTDFYVQTYPGAKRTHKLETRLKEGVAMLIQKMAEDPTMLAAPDWKELADAILKPGGKHYLRDFDNLAKDGRWIMDNYRALDVYGKFNARKTSEAKQAVTTTLFNWKDKLQEQMFDELQRLQKLDVITGNKSGPGSLYDVTQAYKYWGALMESNLRPGTGLKILLNNGLAKVGEKNIGDLHKEIGTLGNVDKMDDWLIARRVRAGYERMDAIRERVLKITNGTYDLQNPDRKLYRQWLKEAEGELDPDEIREIVAWIKENADDYKKIAQRAKNDNISKELAEEMYQTAIKDTTLDVEKWAVTHDNINVAIVRIWEDVGAITHKRASELIANPAYASFRRDIMTLAHNEGEKTTVGTGLTLSSMKEWTGSEKAFLGPLKGQVENLMEATRKAGIIRAFNRFYNMVEANPVMLAGVAQRLDLVVAPDGRGGIEYPQLKDPNIIMARRNGKYFPMAVLDKDILDVINNVLIDPRTADVLEKAVTYTARQFTRGTTAWFPPFIWANVFMDTASAFAQSEVGYKPVIDQAKALMAMARKDGSPEAQYLTEYLTLTGGRQSLARMYSEDRTPEEAYRWLTGQLTKGETAYRWVENIGEFIATPAKVSEDFTRGMEFINARKAGHDVFASLEMAARVSGSFTHIGKLGGRTGKTIVRAGAFINPSLQVFHQYLRTMGNRKKLGKVALLTLAYTAAILGSNYAIKSASKRQRRNYRGQQVGVRESTFFYPLPGEENRKKGRLGKIRLSDNYATAANLISMMTQEYMKEDKFSADEYYQAATAFIPDQLNPGQPTRMIFSWLPVMIGPTLAVIFKKKTYPKVMEMTPRSLTDLPLEEQRTDDTSRAAMEISNRLPVALDLNPIAVDYLIEGHIGRTSRFLTGRTGSRIFTNPVYVDLYLGATRDLEFYYKVRDAITAAKRSYNNKMKVAALQQGVVLDVVPDADIDTTATAAKDAGIEWTEPSPGFYRLMSFQQYTGKVEALFTRYRQLTSIKNPGPATTAELEEFRDNILDSVDELHQEFEKKP